MKRNSVLILVSFSPTPVPYAWKEGDDRRRRKEEGRRAIMTVHGRKKEEEAPTKFPLQGGGKRMRTFPIFNIHFFTVFAWESRLSR